MGRENLEQEFTLHAVAVRVGYGAKRVDNRRLLQRPLREDEPALVWSNEGRFGWESDVAAWLKLARRAP